MTRRALDDHRAPLLFRVAATGRRLLPRGGVRLVRTSPAASRLRRMLNDHAPEGVRCVEVCGGRLRGASLFVDLSCEKYYWLGTHEELVQDALAAQIGPGFTVYDVGAHAGFFSLLASRLAGAGGRVVAFEPQPDNVERLRRNVWTNDARNIEVIAMAASDRDGEAAFIMHESTLEGRLADLTPDPFPVREGELQTGDRAGGGPFVGVHGAGGAEAPRLLASDDGNVPVTEMEARGLNGRATETETVRTATIDALVRDGMAAPDLIKIDVEGAEGAVIRGASRTIDVHRPVLIVEVHSREAGGEVADALPSPYTFRDLATGIESGAPELPAHYLALPVVGPGRLA